MISALHSSCTIPELDVGQTDEKEESDPITLWRNNSSAADQPSSRDLAGIPDAPLQNDCQSQSSHEDSNSATSSAPRPQSADFEFDFHAETPVWPDWDYIAGGRPTTPDRDAALLASFQADYDWENEVYDTQVRHGC
jgi:hypothetical protein